MSITYNITTNFASKDALPDNDPGKVIRGSDFSAEFTGIQAAFLSAAPALNPTFTGTSTFASVDINGGSVDGTTIGASSKAAGSFTTITATGLSILPSVNIDGGAIDGTSVGATVPSSGAFTTLSASNITGPLTGNVTGNVTGDLTGDVVGNVSGNISAVTGTSSFNNVTINGSLDMVAGTSATVTNLSTPVNASDAATKAYVDTGIANLIDSAPGTLDTLNELAAALGDDANFATTTTNALATKLPLAGGTMTGNIAFSSGKVTGLPTPTTASDASTKSYTDDNFLAKTGGALSGALDMGTNKITSSYVPTIDADVANKLYVDGVAGSADAAAASAAAALTSENNAATSETNASNSASAALASENASATLYDSFDDRYLGAKASDPTLDNDGDALITGALYFNTTSGDMKVYSGSAWLDAYTSITGQTLDQVTTTGNTTTNSITVGSLTVTNSATAGTQTANATGATTLDFATYQNFVLTLTGNVTLANPTTEAVGQSGFIVLIQDATGGRTVSLGTDYETAGGAGLTVSSAASATDIVPYVVTASNRILLGAPQLAFS